MKPIKLPQESEADITKSIRGILETVGITHWKEWGGPMSEKGIPDLICIKKVKVADLVAQGVKEVGLFVGIEVKRKSVKELRPAQEKWKRRIEAAAGIFVTARSVDDVIKGLGLQDRFLFK